MSLLFRIDQQAFFLIKMKRILSFFLFITTSTCCFSQETLISVGKDLQLDLGGWVRTEFIYNSRATQEGVDGLYSLYPLNVVPDVDGKDMNANPNVSMSAVATRFTTMFYGPSLGKVTTKAYVEMDFTAKSDCNSFMFRQGWVSFERKKSSLMIGRAWNPLSSYSVPHVLNISMGAPFFSFLRNEQIKYSYTPGHCSFAVAASYQGQYASRGPDGKSSKYMRNAMIPDISLVAQWKSDNLTVGLVGDTKTIQPRTYVTGSDSLKRSTNEKITTCSAQLFGEITTDYVSLRLNGSYTQNMTDGSMLGGYAVSVVDAKTGFEQYTATQHLNGWMSLQLGEGPLKYGIFAGYVKNLGTVAKSISGFYGLGCNIASLMRLSPKVTYTVNNFQVGGEIEYTRALYGTADMTNHGKVQHTCPASNTRLLLMAMYLF